MHTYFAPDAASIILITVLTVGEFRRLHVPEAQRCDAMSNHRILACMASGQNLPAIRAPQAALHVGNGTGGIWQCCYVDEDGLTSICCCRCRYCVGLRCRSRLPFIHGSIEGRCISCCTRCFWSLICGKADRTSRVHPIIVLKNPMLIFFPKNETACMAL